MSKERRLLSEGKISQVYLENGYAYKHFSDQYPLQWIEYEANIQNEVHSNTNLAVPKAEFLKDAKKIKMDYIDGYTLAERMRKEKYKFALDDLIDTQLSIYEYCHLDLTQAHDVFEQQIKESSLDNDLKEKALLALSKIEKKEVLCHFDIHFLNIMYNHSDYFIIDWVNAKSGNPVMDTARTYIILKQYAQRLANKYLNTIVKKGNFHMEEVQAAIPLMAVLRLLENDAINFKEKLLELIM